ncbi:MAG: hypothetical protein V3S60_00205 [Acidimicrobiia bacterium]
MKSKEARKVVHDVRPIPQQGVCHKPALFTVDVGEQHGSILRISKGEF